LCPRDVTALDSDSGRLAHCWTNAIGGRSVSTNLVTPSGVVGEACSFGLIVGPSGHSPVPKATLPALTKAITEKIKLHEVTFLWNGGDPCFRDSRRGGNIADVVKVLVQAKTVKAGA
jgi:hypothetical protein